MIPQAISGPGLLKQSYAPSQIHLREGAYWFSIVIEEAKVPNLMSVQVWVIFSSTMISSCFSSRWGMLLTSIWISTTLGPSPTLRGAGEKGRGVAFSSRHWRWLSPLVPRVQKIKIRQFASIDFGLICKRISRFWHSLLWAWGTYGFNRPVLAACTICFLKTINYIEVQKYLFGINGLRWHFFHILSVQK